MAKTKSTKETLEDSFYDVHVEITDEEDAIMNKLIKLEGYAVWIPEFIFWLFETYDVIGKN